MITSAFFERLADQFEIILLVLNRPVVQRQLLVFAMLALVAELASSQLTALRRRFFSIQDESDGRVNQRSPLNRMLRRWLRAVEHTFSPIVAIALGQIAILIFDQHGWQTGLLRQGLIFFWLLLVYRLVVTVLYALQSERTAHLYQQRLLLPLFILLLVFTISRLLSGIVDLAALRLFTFSENPITLGAFFAAAIVFYGFILLSWIVQSALTDLILPRFGTDPGINNSVRTVSRYIVLSAGILATLGSLGIDLSSLAIIGAGLSVGIGFGLQELVANFVSGILLLFEQSIRPGDIVEVEGKMGIVEKLRIRSTTVRTFDNIEMIVPNQSLLTSSVTTYTHTNRRVRIRIQAGASYHDDPQEVREALLAAANRHGMVLDDPDPIVAFTGYGDSSIDFELIVWIEDISTMMQVRSDLHFMIWREFKKRDIEIPFPQRDLHLRGGVPWEDLLRKPETGKSSPATQESTPDAEEEGKPVLKPAEEKVSPLKHLGEKRPPSSTT